MPRRHDYSRLARATRNVLRAAPTADREHYGGVIRWVTVDTLDGGTMTSAEHVGPDLHDQVPDGEQCRCGWLKIGLL